MNADCLFCKIINKTIKADIVYEDDELIAFNDIAPQAPVHILVVPKLHIPSLNDLSAGEQDLPDKIFLKIKEIAGSAGISEEGYRVVLNCNRSAGQEVFHIHFHLLGGRIFKWPPG
ncbi:MAG: histidine triad nucleotide-binding protein [Candidatus Omnitrophota bacterium]